MHKLSESIEDSKLRLVEVRQQCTRHDWSLAKVYDTKYVARRLRGLSIMLVRSHVILITEGGNRRGSRDQVYGHYSE